MLLKVKYLKFTARFTLFIVYEYVKILYSVTDEISDNTENEKGEYVKETN